MNEPTERDKFLREIGKDFYDCWLGLGIFNKPVADSLEAAATNLKSLDVVSSSETRMLLITGSITHLILALQNLGVTSPLLALRHLKRTMKDLLEPDKYRQFCERLFVSSEYDLTHPVDDLAGKLQALWQSVRMVEMPVSQAVENCKLNLASLQPPRPGEMPCSREVQLLLLAAAATNLMKAFQALGVDSPGDYLKLCQSTTNPDVQLRDFASDKHALTRQCAMAMEQAKQNASLAKTATVRVGAYLSEIERSIKVARQLLEDIRQA